MTIIFISGIIFHVAEDEFSTLNDKVIESLIGICLPVMAMIYAFFDGSRFLNNTCDKLLYLVSCFILQKPILVPMIFYKSFKSAEATANFSE